jgi:hypothetical protein
VFYACTLRGSGSASMTSAGRMPITMLATACSGHRHTTTSFLASMSSAPGAHPSTIPVTGHVNPAKVHTLKSPKQCGRASLCIHDHHGRAVLTDINR